MKKLFTLIFFLYTITNIWAQAGHDYYWVGTSSNTVQGSGEWTDLNSWRLDSLNGVIPMQVPISNNTVYFMAGAFPTILSGADSVIITISNNASCDSFYWDNTIPTLSKKIAFQTNTLGITGPSNINLDIYGMFQLPTTDKLDFDFNGSLRFRSEDPLVTIQSNGHKLLVKQVVFEGNDDTEFRLLDFFYVDDPKEYHYSRRLEIDGGFCYFYRGYLNFNGQDAIMDRFDAYRTNFPARQLNIAGSHIQLIGHGGYAWICNFNAAGTNNSFFDATGSHILVKSTNDLAYAQQLWLGDMSYDTITTDTRYYTYIRRNNPTIQHLFVKNDNYFSDNMNATIENLYLYGGHFYRLNNGSPTLTVENVFVESDCDEFALLLNWQGATGKIVKKTPGTTLTLDKVILNGVIGDISNGQSYVANNSVDGGGNTNWTINASTAREMRFRYSNATATTHYWHNLMNWEELSGATWVATSCLPTPTDNVYFDGSSFPPTGTHRMRIDSMAYCHDMRWLSGIDNRITLYPYLYTDQTTQTLNIFGTIELDRDMRVACIGRTFNLWGEADSIITKGVYMYPTLQVQAEAKYEVIDTLSARILQGLIKSTIYADNITLNLGQLHLHRRQFDSVDCHLTYHRAYPFRDYGGYEPGVSYTGTTTFHFWGNNNFANCSNTTNGDGRTYLYGNAAGGEPGHFPNTIFHGQLFGLVYNMTVHGDLTLLEGGNFHHWVSNPTYYTRIKVLGDQPNGPYNGDMNLTAGKEYVFDSYYSNRYAPTHANFALNSKIEVTGTLNAIGTCRDPITIRTFNGKPMTLSVGASNVEYAFIDGMDNTGNPIINALNSVNGGGNSNINFTTTGVASTLYWRAHHSNGANFEGDWSDPGHWTLNPASLVGDSLCVPSSVDTVVFDALSFSATSNSCFIEGAAFCKTIWVKADVRLASHSLTTPTGNLFISESLLIDVPMTQYDYTGRLTFIGDSGGTLRTSNTTLVNSYVTFRGDGAEWNLVDDFTLQNVHRTWHGIFELKEGTIHSNNHTLNLYNAFYSHGQSERTLDLGTSTVNMHCLGRNPDNGRTYVWYIPNGHRNVDVQGANSTINFYDNNITAYELRMYMGYDSLTWRTVRGSASYDRNRIEYGVVNFMGANEISSVFSYADYQHLNFSGTAYFRGDNLMDSIEFAGGHFYYLYQNTQQHLKSPHGRIITNGSGTDFVNIETYPSNQKSYFHKEWGDYFCLDYVKIKDNEGTRGINPNTGVVDNDLFFYTGTNSDNINGTATGIWNFSLLFSTHTAQAPAVTVCDGEDSVDVTIAITGNDYYDIRYNWFDSLGNTGADTIQVNDDDGDPNTPYFLTVRGPALASGYYAFDVATYRCDKRTSAAIDTAWIYKDVPNTLVEVDRTASCYLTNKGTWIDFYDDIDAKPILSILDSLNSGDVDSLGNVNVSVFFESPVQYYAGRPYLQRHWKITPANNVGAKVRLYFTQAELDSLYVRTFHGTHGMAFGPSNAYLELWKFDAVPHINAAIGSSAPTIVPYTVIPLTGTNRKSLTSTAAVFAIEFEVSSFSHFILTVREPVLLPVELLSFEAAVTAEKEVNLTWALGTIEDLSHFDVLRSVDGVNFEFLKQVSGSSALNYQTLDKTPFGGDNYYRLRIYEEDGSSYLSSIRVVNLPITQILDVYPNPIKEENLTVRLSSETNAPLILEFINTLGQIEQTSIQSVHAGQNVFTLDTKSLGQGIYILRIRQDQILIGQRKISKIE
jgi:hypothetical protein